MIRFWLALFVVGCRQSEPVVVAKADPADSAPVVVDTPVALPPVDPEVEKPKIELQCASDSDCGRTNVGVGCCSVCRPQFGNKRSIARFEAYCATIKVKCPPLACSWATGPDRCVGGKCADPSGS